MRTPACIEALNRFLDPGLNQLVVYMVKDIILAGKVPTAVQITGDRFHLKKFR